MTSTSVSTTGTTPVTVTPAQPVVEVTAERSYRDTTGTRKEPLTRYRALRQAKGYGRVALATALGISQPALWNLENNGHGESLEKALITLQGLPNVGRAVPLVNPTIPTVPVGHTVGYPYLEAGRALPGATVTGYLAPKPSPRKKVQKAL
jgi:DNA-binding XRE family transcriptional regulator